MTASTARGSVEPTGGGRMTNLMITLPDWMLSIKIREFEIPKIFERELVNCEEMKVETFPSIRKIT